MPSLLHANSNWVRDGHGFLRHTYPISSEFFQHRSVPVDVYISNSFTLCHFINTFDCYTVIPKRREKTLLKSHYLFIRFWSITLDFTKCNILWPIYKWKCNCCLLTILSSYYNPIVWLHSSQHAHWTTQEKFTHSQVALSKYWFYFCILWIACIIWFVDVSFEISQTELILLSKLKLKCMI